MKPQPAFRRFPPQRKLTPALVLMLVLLADNDSAALGIEQCVSADGHVYVILATRTASIGTQVTSVALTEGSASACVKQAGASGSVVSAFAGSLGPPLAQRMRTTVLSGFSTNMVSCESDFDPDGAGGKGVLHLPGPHPRTVSVEAADSTEELVPVAVGDRVVPAAIDVRHVMRPGLRCRGDTMAFPLGGSGRITSSGKRGEVRGQTITFDDTRSSRIGNPETQESPDGFLLQGNCTALSTCQLIVFVGEVPPDCSIGPSASAAGFSIDSSLRTGAAEAAMQSIGGTNCDAAP